MIKANKWEELTKRAKLVQKYKKVTNFLVDWWIIVFLAGFGVVMLFAYIFNIEVESWYSLVYMGLFSIPIQYVVVLGNLTEGY